MPGNHTISAHVSIKGEIVMAFRSKLQSIMYVSTIVVLSLLVLTGSASAQETLNPASPEDRAAQNLVPAAGKSLVYFFYGRYYPRGDLNVSLDGASCPLNKDMFVLWEVPAGDHQLEVVFPKKVIARSAEGYYRLVPINTSTGRKYVFDRALVRESDSHTVRLTVTTEPGSVSYYRLLKGGNDDYRLVSIRTSAGRKYVADCSLVSWFQDGALVYQNEQLLTSAE
jgi:hypothetical protein